MNTTDEETVIRFLKFLEPKGIQLYQKMDKWADHDIITPEQLESLFDEWETVK